MDALLEIGKKYGIAVVQDAVHAYEVGDYWN